MKILKLIALGIILLVSSTSEAQVSVNVNIGRAPSWGPSGYNNVGYYYLPDIQAYYDIRASQFIYYGGRNWVRSRQLPRQYRNYDLYNGYKVVLNNYRGNSPYRYYNTHRKTYRVGYRGPQQRTIGRRTASYRHSDNRNARYHRAPAKRHYEKRYSKRNDYKKNKKNHGKESHGHHRH
ncbi:hypothetical protein [Flavobacterium sp. 14A]|uniref:hypothetical protein n=1 Tax=Flavobacterium sp. 14A TaxID=2735896 RepID=UPI00156EE83E|nr:hypothetical protein [Flavobacterium sp. 14A]NRT12682.1 hypothetical protein [Flavobacterium sp. 14A]